MDRERVLHDHTVVVANGRVVALVLLQRNPLEDIENLTPPMGVMVRGRCLTASDLHEMLEARASRQ